MSSSRVRCLLLTATAQGRVLVGPLFPQQFRQTHRLEDRAVCGRCDGSSAVSKHRQPRSDHVCRRLRVRVERATQDHAHRYASLLTPAQLLTCSSAVTPLAAHGARIFSQIMMSAQNSRIILASNRIFVLAPIAGPAPAQAPNVCMLLSEKNGSCVGVTDDGVLYELQPAHDCSSTINPHKHSTSASTSPFCDHQTSLGRRCTPAAAHDGPHNTMFATAACLLDDAATERISQLSSSSKIAVVFFSPPQVSPTAPIDLRLAERESVSVTQRQQSRG